jgi:hypothetical protein
MSPRRDFAGFLAHRCQSRLRFSLRNGFYDFPSLSSLVNVLHSIFAEVAVELMKIETAVNAPLGLPLGHSQPRLYGRVQNH